MVNATILAPPGFAASDFITRMMSLRIRATRFCVESRARSRGYRLKRVMRPSRLLRLKISCVMVCSRVSTSPVTVGRTKASGTCWRSTRIVTVER